MAGFGDLIKVVLLNIPWWSQYSDPSSALSTISWLLSARENILSSNIVYDGTKYKMIWFYDNIYVFSVVLYWFLFKLMILSSFYHIFN